MIHRISVHSLTILFCVNQFSNDAVYGKPTEDSNSVVKCDQLDSFKNVPLDSWPWDCFQSSYSQIFDKKKYKKGILRVAAITGNLNMLKYLIEEKGLPVDVNDEKLLLASATGGNVDLIKYLINEKNLTKDRADSSAPGDNALHKAAQAGKLEAVRFFIETLNYKVDSLNWNSTTPSYYAIQAGSLPVFTYLVGEKGANYKKAPPLGENLIFAAASYGQLQIVKYLVEQKEVDPGLKAPFKGAPVQEACEKGHLDVVKYFAEEKKVDLNVRDINRRTVLHRAVLGKHLEMVKYLIENLNMLPHIDDIDYSQKTPAMEAASIGELSILKYLVDEKNASTKLVTSKEYNMLHLATEGDHLPVVKYLVEEKGFDLNAKTAAEKTAYDIAELWDHTDVLQYLKKLKEKH